MLGLDLPIKDWAAEEGIADQELEERILREADRKMAEKAANFGPGVMRIAEKQLTLQLLDQIWKDHLLSLDHLRQGVGLRAYGQRDPLQEYKREAFNLFEEMLGRLRETVTGYLFHLQIRSEESVAAMERRNEPQEMHETRVDPAMQGGEVTKLPQSHQGEQPKADTPRPAPARRRPAAVVQPDDPTTWGKVPRNAPCPCGSGKKYKHCHGKV